MGEPAGKPIELNYAQAPAGKDKHISWLLAIASIAEPYAGGTTFDWFSRFIFERVSLFPTRAVFTWCWFLVTYFGAVACGIATVIQASRVGNWPAKLIGGVVIFMGIAFVCLETAAFLRK